MAKIVTKEEFKKIKKNLDSKRIGLCHGVFDLVHPGHIIHFEEAKAACDILVVSITAAQYVRKGPDRPYFDDDLRLKFLSEIACIDYCLLSEDYTVDDIIECVEPNLYIKGQEYALEKEDVTGMIDHEVQLVRQHGGDIYYTTGQVFSSTKLINKGLGALPADVMKYMEEFTKTYSMKDVKKYTELAKSLKVLVIGDVIIDKYTYCSIQGLMSKDTAYSARFKDEENHLGGSIAIARHLKDFTDNVTLCSVIGNEKIYNKLIEEELSDSIKSELVVSDSFPTIVKQRFIQKNAKRDEYKKVFVINNIPDPAKLDPKTASDFKTKVGAIIEDYDLVILCDFGHGLINREMIDLIQDKARFLSLNCQTNSTNYGMNIITKYTKANTFALDQKELKLAYPFYDMTEAERLERLKNHLHSQVGFLTRGSEGAYGLSDKLSDCPAVTLDVVDTIGAGDAFFALESLYLATGAPMEIALLMGNIAGALAANIVGNKFSLEKSNVLKFASTLTNV